MTPEGDIDGRPDRDRSDPDASRFRPTRPRPWGPEVASAGGWSSGDYAVVGTTLQIVGEELCEALDLRGPKVLDVAAGNGNVDACRSAPLVRRRLDRLRPGAAGARPEARRAEGWQIEFSEADAEALPFADASFDVVMSTFGIMFTPNQDRAAAEMMRVCKPRRQDRARQLDAGGLHRTGLQDSRQLLAAAGRRQIAGAVGNARAARRLVRRGRRIDQREVAHLHVPLSLAGALPRRVQDLLRPGAEGVRGAAAGEQEELEEDLHALIVRMNRSGDGTMVVPSEYF